MTFKWNLVKMSVPSAPSPKNACLNEADPENISHPEKQNQCHEPTALSLPIPVFQYICKIINWPQEEINKLDIKTRKHLTIHKMFYNNQCIPRKYLPRQERDSGLMELIQVCRMTTAGLLSTWKVQQTMNPIYMQTQRHQARKVSLSHRTKNFQRQVQMEDAVHETETATHSPNVCKKQIEEKY